MNNIYVGIHGTSLEGYIVIKDQYGTALYNGSETGSFNVAGANTNLAWKRIMDMNSKAITTVNLESTEEYVVDICLGLPGVSVDAAKETIEKNLKNSGLFRSITVLGDFEVVNAGANNDNGVLIITGGGSIGIGFINSIPTIRIDGYGGTLGACGSLKRLGIVFEDLIKEECGNRLFSLWRQPINLRELLINNSKGIKYGSLILSLLEHPSCYSDTQLGFTQLQESYTEFKNLDFYQQMNSGKTLDLALRLGKFLSRVLTKDITLLSDYDESVQNQIIAQAEYLVKQELVAGVESTYNKIRIAKEEACKAGHDNCQQLNLNQVFLYGDASSLVEKFLPPILENKLLKAEGDVQFIGAQGACRLAQKYAPAYTNPMLFSTIYGQNRSSEEEAETIVTTTPKQKPSSPTTTL